MKIINDESATLKRGRRVTVELEHGEILTTIKDDNYYQLGGQVGDIVRGDVIVDMRRIYWCSISQKWEYT